VLKYSDVSDITKAPEILGGRVKTLHPSVHGGMRPNCIRGVNCIGILARDIESDQKDLDALGIEKVDFVVCNLYPFKETVAKPFVKINEAVEEIDIGTSTLKGQSLISQAVLRFYELLQRTIRE